MTKRCSNRSGDRFWLCEQFLKIVNARGKKAKHRSEIDRISTRGRVTFECQTQHWLNVVVTIS